MDSSYRTHYLRNTDFHTVYWGNYIFIIVIFGFWRSINFLQTDLFKTKVREGSLNFILYVDQNPPCGFEPPTNALLQHLPTFVPAKIIEKIQQEKTVGIIM